MPNPAMAVLTVSKMVQEATEGEGKQNVSILYSALILDRAEREELLLRYICSYGCSDCRVSYNISLNTVGGCNVPSIAGSSWSMPISQLIMSL